MRKNLLCVAAGVAILCFAGGVQAAGTLLYSFETTPPPGPDGFFGLGATVSQDTIGATDGPHSLKYAVSVPQTFVGARTETVIPAALGNPPGIKSIMFDMTIGPNDVFTGGFALIGVTVFGHDIPDGLFGLQAQFADFEHIDGKGPGTYSVQIDLDSATNPVTFAGGESFNQIFGPGPGQLTVASAFQLFINKSNDAPTTVYIDNIRAVVPEPATGALFSLGAIALGMVARRRR